MFTTTKKAAKNGVSPRASVTPPRRGTTKMPSRYAGRPRNRSQPS
jgi:hypothetical protein